MKLSDLGEFGLIDRIKNLVASDSRGILVGIDDDAAAVQISPDKILLATTDALIEGVHFDLSYFNFYQLGWRALAANLSDIAAMGGQPLYALVSVGLPTHLEVANALDFYRGMKALGDQFQTAIVGGDTTQSPDRVFISITVLGQAQAERLLRRSGAQIGDAVFVTGDLGGSVAGLCALKSPDHKLRAKYPAAIEKHLLPRPRVHEAQFVVENFPIHAMIDISDGLASEVHHICRLSKVGALVYEEKIPIAAETRAVADHFKEAPLEYALYGGEDFELLFTAPGEASDELPKKFYEKFGLPCTNIGVIENQTVRLRKSDGATEELSSLGYDHFRKLKAKPR
ncbi:MAG TPA: thiamine-phosphate kinase [bacterium]